MDAADYTNVGEKLNKVAFLFFEIIEISGKNQASIIVMRIYKFFFSVQNLQNSNSPKKQKPGLKHRLTSTS